MKRPHGSIRSETAVRNGYKFISATYIHVTAIPQRKKVCVRVHGSGYVTAVAAGQSQRYYSKMGYINHKFYSGVGMFDWY